jgi:hypothetical protein
MPTRGIYSNVTLPYLTLPYFAYQAGRKDAGVLKRSPKSKNLSGKIANTSLTSPESKPTSAISYSPGRC